MINVIIPIAGQCRDLITNCLDHLRRYTKTELRIIVINNAAEDVSTETLDEAVDVTVHNETNTGFSSAVNQGIRIASRHSHVLILNDDCFVGPGCVDKMLGHLDLNDRIAGIVPMTDGDNASGLNRGRRRNRFATVLDKLSDVEAAATELARLAPGELGAAGPNHCPFFCALLRREAVDAVGLLNTELYANGLAADDDWCLRASALGWRFAYAVDAFALHIGRETFRRMGLPRRIGSRV
jgi:GT2 family glycosyltransferase